jgi:hypothetical protein
VKKRASSKKGDIHRFSSLYPELRLTVESRLGATRAVDWTQLLPSVINVDSRINYLLLSTALLGTFFSGTATRIVSISMPTIASSLATDLIGISWALLAYQLSNIGLSIIFGRVADL